MSRQRNAALNDNGEGAENVARCQSPAAFAAEYMNFSPKRFATLMVCDNELANYLELQVFLASGAHFYNTVAIIKNEEVNVGVSNNIMTSIGETPYQDRLEIRVHMATDCSKQPEQVWCNSWWRAVSGKVHITTYDDNTIAGYLEAVTLEELENNASTIVPKPNGRSRYLTCFNFLRHRGDWDSAYYQKMQ